MANELVNMSSQFKGLPMGDLIGGPLSAACDAQVKLAQATADFIKLIGFMPPDPANATAPQATRTATFRFKRPVDAPPQPAGGTGTAVVPIYEEEVEITVPLLAIVKVPALSITTVDVNFDMEVKSSFSSKESQDLSASASLDASINWGIFSAKVHIQGSVATHKENTRTSDNSAKYVVSVHAEDKGMPEGLARVLDILQSAVAPRKVGAPVAVS
ncbi:MAG TPA: DUF2589 domain-containing protein [Steroidobacteraceae bacterium]|nr:DUF2589 domain-containing protein [Steroidobacteraceae bacterium]